MPNLQEIDIQLTTDDMEIIKAYVKGIAPPNCYLEVGVYEGGSAMMALEVARPDIEIYGIDILDSFKAKDTRIKFIHGASLDVAKTWNKPIGVLFIDGNHDKAGEDFEAWEKFVVPGGVILFHDMTVHSPKVIEDCNIIKKDNRYETIRIPGETDKKASSIFIVKKK